MKHLFLILISVMSLTITNAQSNVTLLHSKPIDPHRYDNIKGSPYIFENWVKADILPTAGNKIEGVEINFNGYTQLFEVRKGNQFVELVDIDFIGIKITDTLPGCGNMFFLKYDQPKMRNRYPLFVYNGKKYKLVKDFHITLAENKMETPGKTMKFQTFNDVYNYFLWKDQVMEPVRLNRRSLLEKINDPDAEAYLDAEQIDITTEEGTCRLLNWLENKKK